MRTDVRAELIPAGISRTGEQFEEAAEGGGWIKMQRSCKSRS